MCAMLMPKTVTTENTILNWYNWWSNLCGRPYKFDDAYLATTYKKSSGDNLQAVVKISRSELWLHLKSQSLKCFGMNRAVFWSKRFKTDTIPKRRSVTSNWTKKAITFTLDELTRWKHTVDYLLSNFHKLRTSHRHRVLRHMADTMERKCWCCE